MSTTAPSPFLPGTHIQYAWDSTSLGWLKECPRKYQYHMIEGWRSKGESVHLKFGLLYHDALETYDKIRASQPNLTHDEALAHIVLMVLEKTWEYPTSAEDPADVIAANGKPWFSDHPNKTRETLVRSVIWYLDHFKEDPATTVVLSNGKPAVELSFRFELDWGPKHQDKEAVDDDRNGLGQPYILCGHLDRVVEYAGANYVMDRKTSTTALSSSYFDQYDPDNQMSLYSFAAQVIYQTPVKGVIIDAVQIMVGFSRFARGFTYRTAAQLDEWLDDTKSWFTLAEHYATLGHWPMNDKSCHKYGGCTFRSICQKSPEVRERFLESHFTRHPWNPLEVR